MKIKNEVHFNVVEVMQGYNKKSTLTTYDVNLCIIGLTGLREACYPVLKKKKWEQAYVSCTYLSMMISEKEIRDPFLRAIENLNDLFINQTQKQ